jgi:hypothetical protein
MIANFFNQTKPVNFLVLSALVVLVFVSALLQGFEGDTSFFVFVKYGIFLAAAVLSVFVLNFIVRKNSLCEDNSYAILFYILFWGMFPASMLNGGIFVSNFILLFAFRRLYSLRSSLRTREKIFDSAFWIGIASIFYLWSFLYLFLVYAAIWLFRKADWRSIWIPVIGYLTPVFLAYTYLLAFDDLERFRGIWTFDLSFDLLAYSDVRFFLPLVVIGLLFILSIYPTTKKSLLAKIDFKSTWQLLIIHVAVSMLLMILAPEKNGSEFSFLFFPLSIIFANFLQILEKYWIREGILYILFFTLFLTFL